jgi:glucose-induced degradation protein 8
MSASNADITPALAFAQSQLAPRAPTNPQFLEDLERAMALLIFPPENLAPPLKVLLEPALRQSVANRVNEAILSSQQMRRHARMRDLVRLRAWAEQKAKEAKKDLPPSLGIGLDSDHGNNDSNEGNDVIADGENDAMVS